MAWNYLGRKVRDIALGGTPDQQRPCPSGHLIYIILHYYLVMVITIFVHRAYHQYARGYNFPIQTTPKKISVSELGVIFWGSPLFLAVFGHSHFRGATTFNFGPIST